MVWMVSILPLISNSASPLALGDVSRAPTIICITVNCHSFFSDLARSKHLLVFSLSFVFTWWFAGIAKSTRWQVLFSFISDTMTGLLFGIEWFVCKRILCISFSRTYSGLWLYFNRILISCTILSGSSFPPSCF